MKPIFLSLSVVGITACLSIPSLAQQTATWSGGAGNWSDCPPSGNARWNTCGETPPQFPNGNFNAVIDGGPVTATSASIVNLTIGSGGSLSLASGTSGILDITGTSIVNNGAISIASSNGLQIEGNTTVTLSGAGSVNVAASHFTGGNGTPTLISQQHVEGNGVFGLGLHLNNQSLVNANGGTLSVQPISAVNMGTMEASSGSTLAFTNGTATLYNNTGGVIQALGGGTVQLDNGVYTGGTLTTTGTGMIQANNSAVLNGLTNSGTLQISAAGLENTITNTGTIKVPSAILSMEGNVTLTGPGSLIMSGSANLNQISSNGNSLTNMQLIHGSGTILQLPLTNKGTVSADSSGNTLALSGGLITNTATLEAAAGGTLELNTVVDNNGGTIQALTGSTVILTNNSNGSVNGGTLTTIGTGTIQSQNGVLDGTVHVPTNAGTLEVNNFDLFIQGTIHNTGTIGLTGNSCLIMNKPSTLTGSGTFTMASTACIFGAGMSFTNQSTIEGAGTIGDSNPMPITNDGTILANQNSPLSIVPDATGFTNKGKLIVNGGSTLNMHGLFKNLSAGTLTGGTYSVSGTLEIENSVTTNDANISLTGPTAKILNSLDNANALAALTMNATAGTLTLENGQVLATSGSFTNAGRMTIGANSSLKLGSSYTQSAGLTTVDGTLTALTGLVLKAGTLMGKGTVAAVVVSNSTLTAGDSNSQPGKLTIIGTYTQNATAVLDVAIGGTTVGTQYSQVAVSHGVSLNGTLNLKLINGFIPAVGTKFTILTGGVVGGKFATVNGLSINSSEHFEVSYTATAVTLTVASGT